MSPDPAVALVLRLGLALLLGATALDKLRDAAGFRSALAGYEILPRALLRPAAAALPLVEAALALGLLTGAGPAALGAAALLALYAGAIAWALARGRRHIDCGCGGPGGPRPLRPALVLRNLVLVAAALAAASPPAPRALVALDVFTVGAGTLALALLWSAADVALANQARLDALASPGGAR